MKVESMSEHRFHHLEIRGDVEVARGVQTVVADVHDLAVAIMARRIVGAFYRNVRKYGIAHLLEGRGDQRRADRARRVPAAEGEHAAAPAHRDRWSGDQVARQVD